MSTTISLDEPDLPPFRLVTVRGVRPRPGVDLDCPRTLDADDDAARFGYTTVRARHRTKLSERGQLL